MFDLSLKQLKRSLKHWSSLPAWVRQRIPLGQQILMVRTALGMTQEQLAKRVSSSQRAIVRLEKEEGDPQVSTLKRIAESLNCELLIRFVPKADIGELIKGKAKAKAEALVTMSVSSANLEIQKPSKGVVQSEIRHLIQDILDKKRSSLWES